MEPVGQRFEAHLVTGVSAVVSKTVDDGRTAGKMVISIEPSPPTPVHERTLDRVLGKGAADHPHKVALIDDRSEVTYGELYSLSRRYANGYAALGMSRGDAVLIMLDNHIDFVVAWMGANLLGGIEVPVNTAYKGQMLTNIINNSKARLMVLESRYLARLNEIAPSLSHLSTIVVREHGGPDEEYDDVSGGFTLVPFARLCADEEIEVNRLGPWDPLGYLHTSGTTGVSKGVIVPHGLAYTYSMTSWITPEDRILAGLPLFHIGGQWAGVYAALLHGASAAIVPRFHASTFWRDCQRLQCTQTLLIGAMATFLMKQPERSEDRTHGMRYVNMAPVIPDVDEFSERFGIQVGSAYGLTEGAVPIVTPYGEASPGLAGWLRPDFEARIVDEYDIEVAAGVVGELVLRGKDPWSTMAGYHGFPIETADAWRNQWLHTGDLLYRDEEGRFYFVDRKKDAIRVRGENVSSQEVESVIKSHPAVRDAACTAVSSEATEDEIKATVELVDEADIGPVDLVRFLAERLPYFMVPRYIDLVHELPRTPTERVQKEVLRRQGVTETTWDRVEAGIEVRRDR